MLSSQVITPFFLATSCSVLCAYIRTEVDEIVSRQSTVALQFLVKRETGHLHFPVRTPPWRVCPSHNGLLQEVWRTHALLHMSAGCSQHLCHSRITTANAVHIPSLFSVCIPRQKEVGGRERRRVRRFDARAQVQLLGKGVLMRIEFAWVLLC
jgi:hypothetical protein